MPKPKQGDLQRYEMTLVDLIFTALTMLLGEEGKNKAEHQETMFA